MEEVTAAELILFIVGQVLLLLAHLASMAGLIYYCSKGNISMEVLSGVMLIYTLIHLKLDEL